jgi:Protein of unknown function (DUF2384)
LALHSGGWLDASSDAPSGRGFIALLEAFRATGGTAPGAIMGRLLEDHQVGNAVSLAKLIFTGQLFGFEWRAGLWVPMFQFDVDDLALKAAPQRVRAALPSGWSSWTLASWFAAPSAQLDGRSPVDMLDADFDAVLRAAQASESIKAWAPRPKRRGHEVTTRV